MIRRVDWGSADEVDRILRVARIPSAVFNKFSSVAQATSASELLGDGVPSSRRSLHCLAHTCAKGDDDVSPFATCFTFRAICCVVMLLCRVEIVCFVFECVFVCVLVRYV